MLQDKYNRLIIDKLPKEVAIEFKQIKDDTENFSDEDVMDIYKDNFNDLFKIVEDKYPEALKAKKKLIKTAKAKIVKPATEKKKVLKKAEPKKKLVKKAEKVDEIPSDAAKDELKKIESKKAKASKARAEAPKKKVSTAAREKQVKALSSLFKTKDFKDNKGEAKYFAAKILNVYKDSESVSKALTEQLEKDIDALIESKYNVEKMAFGGKLKSWFTKRKKKSSEVKVDVYKDGKLHDELIFSNMQQAEKSAKDYKSLGYEVKLTPVMKNGGKLEGEGVDLFEDYENIPENVQGILDEYSEAFEDGDYKELEEANKQLKKIGYTFEYDLDGQACDLRKIGEKGKSEE